MTQITFSGFGILPSCRMSSLTLARNSRARAFSRVASKFFGKASLRLSHAKVR
jgi:hypothetical protein